MLPLVLQFKVLKAEEKPMWVRVMNNCFNCGCKRADLMCKGNCGSEEFEFGEKFDEEIYDDPEMEEPENIYDDLDDCDNKAKVKVEEIKIKDFGLRWQTKVRIVPSTMDNMDIYYPTSTPNSMDDDDDDSMPFDTYYADGEEPEDDEENEEGSYEEDEEFFESGDEYGLDDGKMS